MRYSKIILFVSILPIFISACGKEDSDSVSRISMEGKKATITVDAKALTKTASCSLDSQVNSLQVFVFHPGGSLDAYASGSTSPLFLTCTCGPMEIYALANAPRPANIFSRAAVLLDSPTYLYDNGIGNLVMVGSTNQTITSSSSVHIPLQRIAARLAILKITNRFSQTEYQSKALNINRIYVINVAGENNYGMTANEPETGMAWCNKMAYSSSTVNSLVCDDSIENTLSYGSSYSYPHYFYVYPNANASDSQSAIWSARFTRLVIEATIDGVTCYYPISIPNIESNKAYTISELIITNPGSYSPDIPVSSFSCSYSVTVGPWNSNITSSTTI